MPVSHSKSLTRASYRVSSLDSRRKTDTERLSTRNLKNKWKSLLEKSAVLTDQITMYFALQSHRLKCVIRLLNHSFTRNPHIMLAHWSNHVKYYILQPKLKTYSFLSCRTMSHLHEISCHSVFSLIKQEKPFDILQKKC